MKKIALMVMLAGHLALADDWGILFFSPEQRASGNSKPLASAASQPAASPEAEPQLRHYNGVLQTPRQKTYWVDGQVVAPPTQGKPGEQIISP